jgi:hypothetical protein
MAALDALADYQAAKAGKPLPPRRPVILSAIAPVGARVSYGGIVGGRVGALVARRADKKYAVVQQERDQKFYVVKVSLTSVVGGAHDTQDAAVALMDATP